MDRTESRNAHPPETASDDSASPINLQVRDRQDLLTFEPVPLRYRSDGLTPERQRAYVEALADCGVVREAAARIGVSEQSINRVRRRADAVSFDRACEAAHMFGARQLRSIAFERAIEGTLKGHYYHGELVSQERVFDNRLLTYLLGKTEHLLEPPRECRAICDDWEPHMEALEQGLEPPQPERMDRDSAVWEDEETGALRTSFPPPEGFDGEQSGVWDGMNWYSRSLTREEQAALDAQSAEETAQDRTEESARRDRFFGFAGDGISSPREAEPSEASEPDLGPIEYKSITPPSPAVSRFQVLAPSSRRKPGPRGDPPRLPVPEVPAFAGMTIPAPPHPNRPSPASLLMNHREQ